MTKPDPPFREKKGKSLNFKTRITTLFCSYTKNNNLINYLKYYMSKNITNTTSNTSTNKAIIWTKVSALERLRG